MSEGQFDPMAKWKGRGCSSPHGKARFRGLVAGAVFQLALSISLCAFGGEDDVLVNAPAREEMLLFQEIPSVYGASRFEQKVTEAPSNVTVINSAQIKKYGYRSLADILQSVGGMFVNYDRNYHYAGIRGVAIPGDYNSRLLVLVDGHRTNDAIYDQAPIGLDFPVDVDLIERVEIIRGPGSSIYGTNALLGVVNVITKRGRDYKGSELSGEVGNEQATKGRLTYGNRFSNGLEMLISGTLYDRAGEDLYFKEFDRKDTNGGVAEGLDYERLQNLFTKISYQDFALEGAYLGRKKGVPTAAWDMTFNDPDANTHDERAFLSLSYDHSFSMDTQLSARLFFDHYTYRGDYPYDDRPAEDGPPKYITKDVDTTQSVGMEAHLSRRFLEKHRLLVGAEVRDDFRQDQLYFQEDPYLEYLDDQRESLHWAVYIQDEYRILENLILNAGLRFDQYDTFGSTLNPRVALIYRPWERTVLKAIYAEAFRAPNAYELYYTDGVSNKVNPDLKPEKVRTGELVWEQYLGDAFRFSTTAYYLTIDDLIAYRLDPSDGLYSFRNVDRVVGKGVELELDARTGGGVEGRLSYALQTSEYEETHRRLTNSPQHMVKAGLVVPLIRDRLFAGAEARYISDRGTLAGKEADDAVVMNLTLFAHRFWKNLEVSASAYNLLDEEYGDPGSADHRQDVIDQDGRTFRLKLTYSF